MHLYLYKVIEGKIPNGGKMPIYHNSEFIQQILGKIVWAVLLCEFVWTYNIIRVLKQIMLQRP